MDSGVTINGRFPGTKINRSRISGKMGYHFFGTISTGNLRFKKYEKEFYDKLAPDTNSFSTSGV